MSLPLQMMPGGGSMPFTGWDWGGWALMSLVAVSVVIGVAVIVVLLSRYERRPVAPTYGHQQMQSPLGPSTVQASSSAKLGSEIIGRVVLSLAPTLMDDERRVMDEMARAGGEVLQSDLPKMTSFSKATVSKAIHGLEVRGIVVREKHKWTYWCKVNPRLVERTLQSDSSPLDSPEPVSA